VKGSNHLEVSPSFGLSRLRAVKILRHETHQNIGMLLLGVYLIIDGLLGFGLNLGSFIFLLYLVALAAGVLILLGK
jgi:hypothetical protein